MSQIVENKSKPREVFKIAHDRALASLRIDGDNAGAIFSTPEFLVFVGLYNKGLEDQLRARTTAHPLPGPFDFFAREITPMSTAMELHALSAGIARRIINGLDSVGI